MGRHYAEKDALESGWGIGACTRCGRTIVLGEQVTVGSGGGHGGTLCGDCSVSPRRQPHDPPLLDLEWVELPQVA